MKKLWAKKHKAVARVKELMDQLFEGRREYVMQKQPSVREVMDQFPALSSPKIVSTDFSSGMTSCCVTVITRVQEDHWEEHEVGGLECVGGADIGVREGKFWQWGRSRN